MKNSSDSSNSSSSSNQPNFANPYELAKTILTNTGNDTPAPIFASLDLYGNAVNVNALHSTDQNESASTTPTSCNHFHLQNESGTGDITLYHVFPGIDLVYNDMHMAYCNKNQQPASSVMEINYCKEGRSECLFGDHQYCYMAASDLSFCSLQDNSHQSEFPTAHYHGITITIDFSCITKEMRNILELLSVNIDRIKELAHMRDFTIIRANQTIEHIFSELYTVPEKIRFGYIRVKILEVLLVLTELNLEDDRSDHAHFSQQQIDTIKKVHAFLIAHFNEHYTIDFLAEHFSISSTVMKKCFKGVYGDSIYSYMKRYRLQVAERLLREGTLSIGQIAEQIGYLNQNKFTSAFSAEYGIPPTAYRKKDSKLLKEKN